MKVEEAMLKGTTDYIIVHSESRFESKLSIQGQHGLIELDIDGEYEDDKRKTWGTVVAIPQRITDNRILFQSGDKYIKSDHIQPDVNVGDKLYFDSNCLQDMMDLKDGHYAIPYTEAVATVRQGRVVPIGSHVLLKPVYDEDVIKLDSGMARVNNFGLVTELNPTPRPYQATVEHLGLPLKGFDYGLAVGQRVVIEKHYYGRKMTIEGEEYLVCREDNIAWIFTD